MPAVGTLSLRTMSPLPPTLLLRSAAWRLALATILSALLGAILWRLTA